MGGASNANGHHNARVGVRGVGRGRAGSGVGAARVRTGPPLGASEANAGSGKYEKCSDATVATGR